MNDLPLLPDTFSERPPETFALFLDVDGTLIEFADTPGGVHVPDSLINTLEHVYRQLDGALALVSGRAIPDLDRIMAPLKLPAAGLHGFDVRGNAEREQEHERLTDDLAREKSLLLEAFIDEPRILIEDKGPCVAVHFRRAPELSAAVYEAVSDAHARLGERFEILSGDKLYEIRPAEVGKGHGIEALMKAAPFKGRTPVFIGDDVTDEDGFETANALGGISVCVGPRRPTKATTTLKDVDAVHAWLNTIAATTACPPGNIQDGEILQA